MCRFLLSVAAALTVLTVGCQDGETDGEGAPRAAAIVCNATYRVAQTEPLTEMGSLRIEDADSGSRSRMSTWNCTPPTETAAWTANARFGCGSLRRRRQSRWSLTSISCQAMKALGTSSWVTMASPASYAYDPLSGAELQYWCTVEDTDGLAE